MPTKASYSGRWAMSTTVNAPAAATAEETGRLILRVNDLPAGGKLTMSAAEYRLAKAALNQLRTQRLAEGGYTDAVDDALARLLRAHTPLFIW
ncbi:MAG: hypothetical protein ACLS45_01285 [Subdoligranulum sp.]